MEEEFCVLPPGRGADSCAVVASSQVVEAEEYGHLSSAGHERCHGGGWDPCIGDDLGRGKRRWRSDWRRERDA